MRKYYFYLLCMLFLLAPDCLYAARCWEGTVVKVVDGISFIVNHKQSHTRVRLYGIDTPSSTQARASMAKRTLQDLVLNKKITACSKKTQSGPAFEVHVLKGFMLNVNREMVRKGLAFSTVDLYKNLEVSARKKQLGLWSDNIPVSPEQNRQRADVQQRAAMPRAAPKKSPGGMSVYKVRGRPVTSQTADNATRAADPEIIEQRQQELAAIREKDKERVSDTRLSLTDIEQFKLSANFLNDWNDSYAGLEISFDYWSTTLNTPVDWNDGDVDCECRVTGHFSEGTNTRIARTNVLLSSFRDRVYIDIPYGYLEDDFIELLSCTVECRISAGIFDLKASDKVYLQFNYRPWYLQRPQHY